MDKSLKIKQLQEKMKENLIEHVLKSEDEQELPMDEIFYQKMHNRIMGAVTKLEVKPLNRRSKAWVFLEEKSKKYRFSLKV